MCVCVRTQWSVKIPNVRQMPSSLSFFLSFFLSLSLSISSSALGSCIVSIHPSIPTHTYTHGDEFDVLMDGPRDADWIHAPNHFTTSTVSFLLGISSSSSSFSSKHAPYSFSE